MKVAALHGDELRLERRPLPVPAPGEVLVQVTHCGICGSDLHAPSYGLDPGFVLGHEITGEIVDVGTDVVRSRIGERIAALPLVGCGTCGACRSGLPARCRSAGQIGLTRSGGFAEFVTTGDREISTSPTISIPIVVHSSNRCRSGCTWCGGRASTRSSGLWSSAPAPSGSPL